MSPKDSIKNIDNKKHNSSHKRAKRLSPEERKLVLLDVGVKAFAENGIGNAVHRDIAKAAHVSLPTVFHYFPTKEILIDSILGTVKNTMLTKILPHIQLNITSEQAFIGSSKVIVDMALYHPEQAKVWLMWGVIYKPELRAAYLLIEEEFMKAFIQILQKIMPLDTDMQLLRDRARLIMGAGIMLTRFALDTPNEERIEKYVNHVMSALLSPI